MPRLNSKNFLRLAIALCGVIPVVAGAWGMVTGTAMLDRSAADIDLDSDFRYLSGVLLAIGLGFWSTVPEIERTTTRFRLLTVLVLIGGIGRLIGAVMVGLPHWKMVVALAMELVATPLLCLWQSTVAREGMDRRD